jgi:hypothetical protein
MAHPWYHAERTARLFGGIPEDYVEIHNWFDESKAFVPDLRHRALRHHSEGIFLCERIFGTVIANSDDKKVPVRFIGEQHVKDDLGWVPTVMDWLGNIKVQGWMQRTAFRPSRGDAGEPYAAPSIQVPSEEVNVEKRQESMPEMTVSSIANEG